MIKEEDINYLSCYALEQYQDMVDNEHKSQFENLLAN